MVRTSYLAILAVAGAFFAGAAPAADKGTAVVVGGGQSGAPLARILTEQGYTVRVMVRDPSRARGLPPGVQVIAGDATKPDTLAAGFAGADYVISTIGAACVRDQPYPAGAGPADVDFQGVANMADAAKAAKVSQFVLLSALGAGNPDPKAPLNALCGMVLEWKGKGEAHLRSSGLPYTIVRPGGLKPFPGQPPCMEAKEGLALYAREEDRGPGMLCRGDVAMIMIDALGNPDAIGKTVNVVADKKAGIDAWKSAWSSLPAD